MTTGHTKYRKKKGPTKEGLKGKKRDGGGKNTSKPSKSTLWSVSD